MCFAVSMRSTTLLGSILNTKNEVPKAEDKNAFMQLQCGRKETYGQMGENMVYCDVIEIMPHNIGQTKEALIKLARADGERFCFQASF